MSYVSNIISIIIFVAGAGFEPATSRLWASRATTALPRDMNRVFTLNYTNYLFLQCQTIPSAVKILKLYYNVGDVYKRKNRENYFYRAIINRHTV